ncbi:MAG TPA: DUF559 domain-containing protein [Mycobacteriales bacterium]|nr:DUF559 domain-containing protein [Mycobacteriales bacterium]
MFESRQVVHRNQILASGVSGRELAEFVYLGVITRLWRGWYTTGEPVGLPDPRGVTRSMRAVLSHESAAAWTGAEMPFAVSTLHVTAPRNRGRCAEVAPGIRLHRRDIAPHEVRLVRGVRVTSPERTFADLARTVGIATAVAVGDAYLRRRVTTLAALSAYADGLAYGPGRPSVRRAAALLDAKSGSVFESLTRVVLLEAGLPAPRTQFNVRDREGAWIGRVDFAWPESRVILECDGFEFHSSRAAFERDRKRWSALTRAGWRVLTVTWSQVVSEPSYLAELVAEVLGASISK